MLKALTPNQTLWAIFALMLAAITGAWIFEWVGYLPCELCLKQRWAYYAIVPLSFALALAAKDNPKLMRYGLIVIGLIAAANCIFGLYHSGVEWKFWAGPTSCTGGTGKLGLPDLNAPVVMCDQPAIRILGVSLAGYSALISAFVSWLALRKA